MNSTIGDRFAQLISALQLSTNAFAISLGKSYSSMKVIIDGTSKPGYEVLEKTFSTYPNLSRDWLIMGEGEMFRSTPNQQTAATVETGDTYLKDHLKNLEDSFSRLSNQLERKDEQIGALQRMLEVALGKYNRVPFRRVWAVQDESKKEVA